MTKPPMAARSTMLAAMASLVGLTACTTYVYREPAPPTVVESSPAPVYTPPPQPVYTEPTTVEVVIHDDSDFYEPLTPYGHWESVGSYGRCWVPARVEPDWRPYSNGHWERTDAGWYWVSDEPWGWATYHYGRWDFDARVGWYWIPQTMWAPAWVTWHRGDGYIGWSPLPPSARIASSGVVEVDRSIIPQRGYVFVEERHFLEPVRPTTIVNNTTIINKTVNITNVRVVNKTVINEGPRTEVIEQASGRKVRAVPAHELRDRIEAPVAASHRARGNERALDHTTQQAPTAPGVVAPARPGADAERTAAEAARQNKIESDRQAQEQARKAQAEAERARVESDRQAKIQAERQAQADRARVEAEHRKTEADQKAQLEAEQRAREQARQAQADAARQKQEADLRARQQADRDARQTQAQMEEARRKQELDRKAQDAAARRANGTVENKNNEAARDAQGQVQRNHPANAPQAPEIRPNPSEKKNQTEAERRAREQEKGNRKGQNKKGAESAPATNAPVAPR